MSGAARARAVEVEAAGAGIVIALHALVKAAREHADEAAIGEAAERARAAIAALQGAIGGEVTVTFLRGAIHVAGQPLRGARAVYAAAIELGRWLREEGVGELGAAPGVDGEALAACARALADPSRRGARASIPGVALRASSPALERDELADDAPPHARLLRTYAAALVMMRRFYEGVAAGQPAATHRVKRLAQELAALAASRDPALLGLVTFAGAYGDDAGRAVQAALLAIATARELTADPLALARIAAAALMADVGRARLLAGEAPRDRAEASALAAAMVPAGAAICVAAGGLSFTNALRTVIAYEATWLEREALLGPLYRGRHKPLLQSEILKLVRAYLDRIAPRAATRPLSPLDALADLTRLPAIDPAVFRLFVRALGVLPVGSVVELETGEWAVVVGPSANAEARDRPRVRLLTGATGHALAATRDVDLGAPAGGRWAPGIARVVGPAELQFNVARYFLDPTRA